MRVVRGAERRADVPVSKRRRIAVRRSPASAAGRRKTARTRQSGPEPSPCVILGYGAGTSDSNARDKRNLPLLLLGGGSGQLRSGQHLRLAPATLMTNLLVTLMDKMGVSIDNVGDSIGKLRIDTLPTRVMISGGRFGRSG